MMERKPPDPLDTAPAGMIRGERGWGVVPPLPYSLKERRKQQRELQKRLAEQETVINRQDQALIELTKRLEKLEKTHDGHRTTE